MTSSCRPLDQPVDDLLSKLLDGELGDDEFRCLADLVRCNSRARQLYYDHIALHAILRWMDGGPQQDGPTASFLTEHSSFSGPSPSASSPAPILGFLSTSLHGTVGFFSQEVPFAWVVAAVVVGIGLTIGANVYVSHPEQLARHSPQPMASAHHEPMPELVGRITGMVDCKWSKGSRSPYGYDDVPIGRQFGLNSGLMEITYDSGAKVILQGPCTYEVDSAAGGFLSLGKLTAKVGEGSRSKVQGSRPENHKSEIRNQKSPSPLFTVKTPSAIVTDLGTEFGVVVTAEGRTETEVFQGAVTVATAGTAPQVVGAGQLSRSDGREVVLAAVDSTSANRFIRALPATGLQALSEKYDRLVLSLDPMAYYRMQPPPAETPNLLVDSSPAGRHGELRFSSDFGTPWERGPFGGSLFFHGPVIRNYALVYPWPKAPAGQLSVSAWVMAIERVPWAMIAANWGRKAHGNFHFGLYEQDGDLAACVARIDRAHVFAREGPVNIFPLGTWQHVAFVFDRTVLRLYRNGNEVASTTTDGLLDPPEVESLAIGAKTDDTGDRTDQGADGEYHNYYHWHGRIAELAIFHSALSAEDIAQLHRGRLSAPEQKEDSMTQKH